MLLAGDVGGTKTFLGLFRAEHRAPRPPSKPAPTARSTSPISARCVCSFFARRRRARPTSKPQASASRVPITGTRAQLTNVPWVVDLDTLRSEVPIPRAYLLNDLEALAWSVPVLTPDEIEVLHEGQRRPSGQRRADCRGHRPRHRPAAERRWAARAARVGRRTRRLRAAQRRRTVARRCLDQRVRTRRRRARRLGTGPREHPHGFCIRINARRSPRCRHRTSCPPRSRERRSRPRARCASARWNVLCRRTEPRPATSRSRCSQQAACISAAASRRESFRRCAGPIFMRSFLDKSPMDALISRIPVKVILNPGAGLLGAASYADSR